MRDPEWGWRNGFYEIFCCEQAVKIAEALKTGARITDFERAQFDERMKMVPEFSDTHSGNTAAVAIGLAFVYVTSPSDIPKMHGALCPLVGCVTYGCWASRHRKNG